MSDATPPDGTGETPVSPDSAVDPVVAAGTPDAETSKTSLGTKAAHSGRSIASTILVVLGVLCLVLSLPTVWGRNLVLNTNRYVETLAPLASNPGVQQAIVAHVDKQVMEHVDVSKLVTESLPPKAHVLAGPLQSAFDGFVHTATTRFVQSKAFQVLWVEMNRSFHKQLVFDLTGHGKAVKVENGRLVLDLAPVVQGVKAKLTQSGLAVASHIPAVNATIDIANARGLAKARRAVNAFNTTADWLPWLGLALVAAGIALARRRRHALIGAALGLMGGMLVLGIAVLLGRNFYLNGVPPDVLPRSTAASIFDTLVRYLRDGIRIVFLLALCVAIGAAITGHGQRAIAIRSALARGPRWLGGKIETTAAGVFVEQHANALRIGVVALALLVLLLVNSPTLGLVILLVVLGVLLLATIEVLRAGVRQQRTESSVK